MGVRQSNTYREAGMRPGGTGDATVDLSPPRVLGEEVEKSNSYTTKREGCFGRYSGVQTDVFRVILTGDLDPEGLFRSK